jgi:dipeptidyl-peptidase-4
MPNKRITSAIIAVLSFLVSASVAAQEERLELDWFFTEEGKSATALPRYTWLDTGTVVLYDMQLPKNERTIETVNPANGRRRAMVDAEKAIASLTELMEPKEAYEELGWPSAFNASGRWALYQKSGDIVLLDTSSSEFIAVAMTGADESSGRFSPDGKWLAFVRDNDIYAWNIEEREETRLTRDGSDTLLNGTLSWVYWEELFNRSDRGYVWSPDSSAIAYLQSDESGVGEMHYVDFEPYLPRLITQRHAKPGEANPRVRAGVVNLEDARTTWVDLGSYPYEYLVRLKWLPDSERLAVQTMNRPQTALDIYIADAESGNATHLMRETDEGWVNVHDDLYFLQDSEQFIWRSERNGYAHLYMFDMTGELSHQVTAGEWALRSSGGTPGMSQAVSFVDEDAGQIYFTALEKASTERHLYRIDFNGDNLQRLSGEDGSHSIRFGPGNSYYIDTYSALDQPPSLALLNTGSDRITVLADSGDEIQQRFDLQNWELFSIDARDGFEMPAMMLKPRFFDPEKKYPVVTYVYGGPSAPTVSNAWQGRSRGYYHQLLADSGVIVFLVDNRSAAGKSKIDANTILRQLYGPIEMNDLLDGIVWLKSQPYVDADRVGIWGWSGGGSMTLQAMTSSGEFAAGASVAPVSDWRYYDTIYTERYMKRPEDNEEGYNASSHAQRAAALQGRLMLVHGTYDDNVHPQNSWAFSDGLIEAGITFDMMIYPMRKHGISDDAAQLHVYKSMYEFWQRNFNLGD